MKLNPLTVIVDAREQRPWEPVLPHTGGRRIVLPSVTAKLEVGDYSVMGCEGEIAIERKSLADWVGTMFGRSADGASRWECFKRELERATKGVKPDDGSAPTPALQRFLVIVESSREEVYAHAYRSEVPPASVIGRSDSVLVDYGVPVIWAGDREEAARLGIWTLARWWGQKWRGRGASEGDVAAALRQAERAAKTPTVAA